MVTASEPLADGTINALAVVVPGKLQGGGRTCKRNIALMQVLDSVTGKIAESFSGKGKKQCVLKQTANHTRDITTPMSVQTLYS